MNGNNVGTNSNTYTKTGFADGDVITCTVVSTEPCATPASLTLSMTVSVYDVSFATLSVDGPSQVCSGTSPTYYANATNAGTNPTYQWKKNGLDVGTNQNNYTPDAIAINDVITCVLTTDPLCGATVTIPASNIITITSFIPSVIPTISIVAGNPLTSLSNTFTATITNGGNNPVFIWYKNGFYADSGNQYMDAALVVGDVIYCSLYSDATCANPSSLNSNELVVAPIPAYCIPTSGSGYNPCENSWITNVQLGTTLNKTTGCGGFYSDFTTTDTLKAAAGETIAYNLLGGSNGTNWYQHRVVYIDFNNDKDFTDAGEMVVDIGDGALNNSIGTFILPQQLSKGSYRIRVIAGFDINFSSCNVDGGEAEDYILLVTYCTPHSPNQEPACQYYYTSNVTLGSSVNNTTGCNGFYSDFSSLQILTASAGQTINYSVSLENIAGQNWGSAVNIFIDYNNDVDFDDAGEKVANNIPLYYNNPAAGNFTLPALLAFGSYRIRIVNAGSYNSLCELNYGEVEDYTLFIPEPVYCIPVISNPCDMWISNVTIGAINNTSSQPATCGAGGYTDYSGLLSVTAAPGQILTFSLTGHSNLFSEPWQKADIYIDFNNDGDFDDIDEVVVANIDYYTDIIYNGSFSIPAAQPYGYYRMRVKSYNYNEPQTGACGNNTNGETEDYMVIVNCVPNGSDIVVKGNNIGIDDGDFSPDINDHTDFGNAELGSNLVRTFTVTNTGTNTLNLGNVSLTGGTNNAAFSIASQPVLSMLSVGASTTFSVQFASPVWGYGFNFNTTVHVASDNCDKKDYDFAIKATAACPANGPDINIQGNGIDIERFDFTPDPADNTDFGIVTANNTLSKTFVIQNTGNTDLHLSGIQLFNYDNLLQFAITAQPASIVVPGSSTSFTLTFAPVGSGSRYAYVRIDSDDCDESYYNFKIIGEAACPALTAEVNVKGNGIDIVDGDNAPEDADNTHFGLAALNTSVSKTFVIENTGVDPLNISGVTFTGTGSADFSVTIAPATSVAPGMNTSFTVRFLSTVSGLKNAVMHISNSDCDEGDYDMAISGTDGTVCTPVISQPCDYMYISNVTIGSINNNSACSYGIGYSDYTATLSHVAAPGGNVQFAASAYGNEQKVNVYIDYNKDGDFVDAGELLLDDVYMSPDMGNGIVNASGSFIVPLTQAPGNYRVRVISQWNNDNTLTPCYTNYGEAEDYTLIIQSNTSVTVDLKLFLQGYYAGANTMQPVLNNQSVPLSLPNETDTIIVELHDPSTYVLVDSKQAVLLTDGTVAATFDQPAGPYYIAIKHRNSIQTWSTDPLDCPTQSRYDFSIAANKAMGDNQAEIEAGVWAFYTGDINQDEYIDGNDFPQYDAESASGGLYDGTYTATDMNGDGFVDGNDFPVYDGNSSNGVSSIHP